MEQVVIQTICFVFPCKLTITFFNFSILLLVMLAQDSYNEIEFCWISRPANRFVIYYSEIKIINIYVLFLYKSRM